jgi:WD40 repeat protein
MIKKNKIEDLIQEKVVPQIETRLLEFQFKFQKSKKSFFKQLKNGFVHKITIYPASSPIIFNEETDKLFLVFYIDFRIENPAFDKWIYEKFDNKEQFSFQKERYTTKIELSFEDFTSDSFYTPTPTQQFKQSILNSFIQQYGTAEIISYEVLIKEKIPYGLLTLDAYSDILTIFESHQKSYNSIFLLVFGGYMILAKELFNKDFESYISNINIELQKVNNDANRLINNLESFIAKVNKVTDLSLVNPFKRSIKIRIPEDEIFEFSQKVKFKESLRLNISSFQIEAHFVNFNGFVLLITNNHKIIKLDPNGNSIFEYDIKLKKGFRQIDMYRPKIGEIRGTNDFYFNNYIITSQNDVIELVLPTTNLKKGVIQNSTISDFAFWSKMEKYLIFFENNLLFYKKNGELEKSILMNERMGEIIIEKEWVITHTYNVSTNILNFEGEILGTYETANGNTQFEFAPDYNYLTCFAYSTKSQFFDISTGKNSTLWAHPTFVKGYKELMYNDIENNFGMDILKFSPDNKYMVGGAYHGKYVAWTLPSLKRVELIPSDEMIELFEPIIRQVDGVEIAIIAEKIKLDDQIFFKNRRNHMTKIIFFENGDIFITEIGNGKFVLSWDRNFNNLNYKKIKGKLDFHSGKYLTQQTDSELIIYIQK